MKKAPLILQIVGYKNSGKTTLSTRFIQYLTQELAWSINTIKHDAHEFSLDQPGTDTWRHREAGADLSMIQSAAGLGITLSQKEEQSIEQLISLTSSLLLPDLVIIEGFKQESYPKLLLLRGTADFILIEQLSNIEALVFQTKEAAKEYTERVESNLLSLYPTFLLGDISSQLDWLDSFIKPAKEAASGEKGLH